MHAAPSLALPSTPQSRSVMNDWRSVTDQRRALWPRPTLSPSTGDMRSGWSRNLLSESTCIHISLPVPLPFFLIECYACNVYLCLSICLSVCLSVSLSLFLSCSSHLSPSHFSLTHRVPSLLKDVPILILDCNPEFENNQEQTKQLIKEVRW